jgi:hypothetical protein
LRSKSARSTLTSPGPIRVKARTQSPCFSYSGLARAFQSAGSADLSSFGGVSVGWPPDLLCWLPVYDRAEICGRFIC